MDGSVPRETASQLTRYEQLVVSEARRQNLVAASTLDVISSRHIRDSLQLLPHLQGDVVVDIGSGAGFPGMVLAIAQAIPVTLIEPRRLRAAFLDAVVAELGLGATTIVIQNRVEAVRRSPAGTITARAVAPLHRLFEMAAHLSDSGTVWVLPKGRGARDEVALASRSWHGDFDLVPSATDREAAVVVVRDLRRRGV